MVEVPEGVGCGAPEVDARGGHPVSGLHLDGGECLGGTGWPRGSELTVLPWRAGARESEAGGEGRFRAQLLA